MEMLSFDCVHDALQAMTEQLAAAVRQKTDGPFHIALSGGGTAKLLFRLWAQEYVRKIAWSRLRFYWVDERCVPPDDPESKVNTCVRNVLQVWRDTEKIKGTQLVFC